MQIADFSQVDRLDRQEADLHRGQDSTLNVVWNEIKCKADVVKQYGRLPPVECMVSQLNQVFTNWLVNAAQAIDGHGTITYGIVQEARRQHRGGQHAGPGRHLSHHAAAAARGYCLTAAAMIAGLANATRLRPFCLA